MEGMKCKLHLALAMMAVAFMAAAQAPQVQAPGLTAAMTKLFGDNQAFSAMATATIIDTNGDRTMTMPMKYAVLDGKIWSEVDMTQVKSKALQTMSLALKQVGMDRTTSIVRPDQRKTFVIYPSLRAYTELPVTNNVGGNASSEYKVDSMPLGKETVDGHPCEKKKVAVSRDGEKHEAIVWNATDMKNFPVKMEMTNGGVTTVMTYRDVKFEKPDAKLFEPPAGFDKYDSFEKMVQGAMMKLLATPPPQR
jgi:hypothetical protein